jgi:hydrogenase 3 maturation protease
MLERKLKDSLINAERVALLGVGSELRGDDAAGVLVAGEFRGESAKFKVFIGGTAPENLTGEIKKFNPTHLIIVDSAEMSKPAGTVQLFEPEDIAGVSFCTHQLPLTILAGYIKESIGCKVLVIGIQPKKINFSAGLSREVQKSIKYVSDTIKRVILSLDIGIGFC